jgi:ABC-type transport system substrate-binding protein
MYSARKGDVYSYETHIDELLRLAASTFDNEEAFEYYKEFQILFATRDLGLIFYVNQLSTYAVYDHVGNGILPTDVTALSGYIWEMVYLK